MKSSAFDYHRATSVEDALRALEQGGDGSKLLGGGQSLGPMMNLRLARAPLLVDVSALEEREHDRQAHEGHWIKGTITHSEIEDGKLDSLFGEAPPIAAMLRYVAAGISYRAVRNRGTLAGSLAHADPAADWVLAMVALGASVHCRSASDSRLVPMSRFMLAAYATTLDEHELITGVVVPNYSADMRWGYYKFCRKAGEFADASCAAVFDPEKGVARIAAGALNGAPILLTELAEKVAANGLDAISDEAIWQAVETNIPDREHFENQLTVAAIKRCVRQALGAENE